MAEWQRGSAIPIRATVAEGPRALLPLTLDAIAEQKLLALAPTVKDMALGIQPLAIRLPRPDGQTESFRIWEIDTFEPALAAQFPQIKTYRGQGIDDPTAILATDMTEQGFHARVLRSTGGFAIEPVATISNGNYQAFFDSDFLPPHGPGCQCAACLAASSVASTAGAGTAAIPTNVRSVSNGTTLRTFRLAVASTGEYTTMAGGTVGLALSAITTVVNSVNAIYERDFCIHMNLVANEPSIIYTDSTTDPYTGNNIGTMIGENQANITSVIGSANYDIGHLFGGLNLGGVAGLGVVGNSATKAQGITTADSSNQPTNYWMTQVVSHEIGHQFNAGHTFNGVSSSLTANRMSASAWEPGSGSTIMAYGHINQNGQGFVDISDIYFHSGSIQQVTDFLATIPSVGTSTATGNDIPTISMGANKTIPANTALQLTAAATDGNGAITYTIEELDLGPALSLGAADNGSSPLFRSFPPSSSNSRYFPSYATLLANIPYAPETLPSTNRTMTFRGTARDNIAGGGAQKTADVKLTVVNTGSAFAVTSPTTGVIWGRNTPQTATWNVAGTTANGINVSTVNILLSTDGGLTFPTVLASGTANDGSELLTMPNVLTSEARIKIESVGNVFFDISNVNFSLVGTTIAGRAYLDRNNNAVDNNEPGIPGVTVYDDVNNNGVYDTITNTVNSLNVPLAIPDNNTVNSALVVSGLTNPIADINVKLNISHPYDADLLVFLVGPNGVPVALTLSNGGSGVNYTNTNFDDQAPASITDGSAPFAGSYRPQGSLATLNGTSANGIWTLQVTDAATGETGTLNSWSVTIVTSAESTVITEADGAYTFINLISGTHQVRLISPPSVNLTTANSATVTVGDGLNPYASFDMARQDAAYGRLFLDANINGIDDGESPLGGWTVFDDLDNNGTPNSVTQTLNSTNVPIPIPDVTTKISTLAVSNVAGLIQDLNVKLNITHSFDGDLDIFLISPTGIRVELSTGNGVGEDYTNTIFDDQATVLITAGLSPFTGSYRPEGSLAALNGASANGNWTLEITDTADFDTGVLNSWSLTIVTAEPSTVTASDGYYELANLSSGTHRLRRVLQSGYASTSPVGGQYFYTHVAGASDFGNNFGQAPPNTTLDSSGNLIVDTGVGRTDNVTLKVAGPNYVISDPNSGNRFVTSIAGSTGSGTNSITVPINEVTGTKIQIKTNDLSDSLTVDLSGGNLSDSVSFDGGTQTGLPGDSLVITGGSFAAGTHTFTSAGAGTVTLGSNTLAYTGLEPVDMRGSTIADLVFILPPTASNVFLEDDGTSGNWSSRLRSANSTFETTVFSNPTNSLTINRGQSNDSITIASLPDFDRKLTMGTSANPFGSVLVPGPIALASNYGLSAYSVANISLTGNITTTSGPLMLSTARSIQQTGGVISVGGVFTVQSALPSTFNSTGNKAAQLVIPAGVTCLVNGSFDSTGAVQVDGALGGSGSVGTTSVTSTGKVAPGSGPGKLATGNIAFNSGSLLTVELNGANPGADYDQLVVSGTLNLGGATLNASLSYTPTLNQAFKIIDNDGTLDAVTGTFNGYVEGATSPSVGSTSPSATRAAMETMSPSLDNPPRSLPPVTSVVLDEGTGSTIGGVYGTVQRSEVCRIIVTFSEAGNFTPSVASAFTLTRSASSTSPGTTGPVTLMTNPVAGPASSVTITFTGTFADSTGSLVDGIYNFSIDASKVSGVSGQLNGSGNGAGTNYTVTGTTANKWFRYFGDQNGDGIVSHTDYLVFRNALAGGLNSVFDYQNSGDVDQSDYLEFQNRLAGAP
ncbi:MAG: reprolysin-like metallopeptidase [Gemmataceae bacterium]